MTKIEAMANAFARVQAAAARVGINYFEQSLELETMLTAVGVDEDKAIDIMIATGIMLPHDHKRRVPVGVDAAGMVCIAGGSGDTKPVESYLHLIDAVEEIEQTLALLA